MPLTIIPFVLGPLENNSYLLTDTSSGKTAVIDPSFESEILYEEIQQRGWKLSSIWLTHAHFDHIAGISALVKAANKHVDIGLHPGDLVLWKQKGGATYSGVQFTDVPDPTLRFSHGQILTLGAYQIEVRHAPGHTRGHVIFVVNDAGAAFCGDVIFHRSIGRTDLPGGDFETLIDSIKRQVLTLPGSTRLLSGHGAETTVAEEATLNPFLK